MRATKTRETEKKEKSINEDEDNSGVQKEEKEGQEKKKQGKHLALEENKQAITTQSQNKCKEKRSNYEDTNEERQVKTQRRLDTTQGIFQKIKRETKPPLRIEQTRERRRIRILVRGTLPIRSKQWKENKETNNSYNKKRQETKNHSNQAISMVKESSINENAQEVQCHKVVIDNEDPNNVKEPSGIVINQQTEHNTQTREKYKNEEVLQIDSTCSTCLPTNIIEQPGIQLMVELYANQEQGLHNKLEEVIKHPGQVPTSSQNMKVSEQQENEN
uniref:Uncharacterized protein LOC104216578 n=1 Tax=Nicotiana sylvestris TaxID=4096 RepID=A0A1U7VAA4_NICSY|nr:PREDICTED: uncharacterized protein LOC104216578 [Nicotiana sylvestris]